MKLSQLSLHCDRLILRRVIKDTPIATAYARHALFCQPGFMANTGMPSCAVLCLLLPPQRRGSQVGKRMSSHGDGHILHIPGCTFGVQVSP